MSDIKTLLILIPALPLAAALVTAALGKHVLRSRSHWPTIVAIAGSLAASVLLVFAVARDMQQEAAHPGAEKRVGYEKFVPLWTWATVADAYQGPGVPVDKNADKPASIERVFQIDIVLRADPLTAIMLATVTFVSLLVAIYSVGYMHDEPGYCRFFSYIPLFVFSMTMLVSASNFVLLYVFWEAVGLCSYLLISFWFQKPVAAAAGMKAFLVNRVGDFGFALGVFLLWATYGTLNYHDSEVLGTSVPGIFGQARLASGAYVGGGVGTAICLLLMLGACGKSAQFPLHVWLPDAMVGPAPVSALIHAATMVTAGVYMVARCTPLFVASADAQQVVAVIGCLTAILAAVIAIVQTDLKRILAYSTISQLGYMFLGLGAGTVLGITAGMFHLVTHAFFKALLFLGAGSVMHAMGGVIDIREFGGLRRRMPATHWTFLVGCLALAGVVPFAGFWSKDAILLAIRERGTAGQAAGLYQGLYLVGTVTAFLTAVYTFRLFRTFYGPERIPPQAGHHAVESPASMTGPLVILALGAFGAGWYFQWTGDFLGVHSFLSQTPSLAYSNVAAGEPEGALHANVAGVSTLVAVAGVALAWLLYLGPPQWLAGLSRTMAALGFYGLARGKFYFDETYRALVIGPLKGLSRLLGWADGHIIDELVNAIGRVPTTIGAVLRPLQGGMVQFYALAMVLGLLALIGSMFM